MIDTYVFDFDGTVADSMPTWSKAMMNVIIKSGVVYPDNIIEILTPLGDGKSAIYLREKLGVKFSEGEIKDLIAEYATPLYLNEVQPKDGVIDYLKKLKSEGKKVGLLTASTHKRIDGCIKRWGAWDLFDAVKTCEDYLKPKSDPTIYKDLLRDMGSTAENTAFFDDNLEVVRTVKLAGLTAVGVFDESGKKHVAELQGAADVYIESFENLGLL